MKAPQPTVGLSPDSRPPGDGLTRPTRARSKTAPLFDHLVGAKQDRLRHRKAERLGGLEVDDHLDACGLLNG
jgi:hypothetical protein